MIVYQKVAGADGAIIGILRVEDNIQFPLVEGNSDYEAFRQWVAMGNVPAEPEPSDAELDFRARSRRATLLEQTDARIAPLADAALLDALTDEQRVQLRALVAYRQALRDVTLQPSYPRDVHWPEAPAQ
jgi:hypothetical protein